MDYPFNVKPTSQIHRRCSASSWLSNAHLKKNTNVIEIKPSNHPNSLYKRISNINKLKHIKVDKRVICF